jgi:hypothetical protein
MRKSHNESNDGRPGLPLVVQLSFAGSRMLFDPKRHPRLDREVFERDAQRLLRDRIEELQTDLELTDRHFWCGISQIAIGGDTLFARVCQDLKIRQRIFLPQHRDDFLAAQAKNGQPDFSVQEQQVARDLLASPHIIQEQVVSGAADRQERFEEVNRELARAADVIICLVRDDATIKPGGSLDLMEQGRKRRRPVLEIRVSVGPNGLAAFSETWHHREFFKRPSLPHELDGLQAPLEDIPKVQPYCEALKDFASAQARAKRAIFKYSAITIVATHFLATLCAVWALRMVDSESRAVPWLLAAELMLLFTGFVTHQLLHLRHASAVWGMSRLVAEIGRSVLPMASVPAYLSHLFTLPMPDTLRSLLRTLNVLHLTESRRIAPDTLPERRKTYINQRLVNQIEYYDGKIRPGSRWLRVATMVFLAGSLSAFAATSFKLVLHCRGLFDIGEQQREDLTHWLGSLAILLPVVAVAALSLAASLDLHARVSTYREMLDFLKEHRERMNEATSEREFAELAIESETRLLGETATWYSRRSYTSVA